MEWRELYVEDHERGCEDTPTSGQKNPLLSSWYSYTTDFLVNILHRALWNLCFIVPSLCSSSPHPPPTALTKICGFPPPPPSAQQSTSTKPPLSRGCWSSHWTQSLPICQPFHSCLPANSLFLWGPCNAAIPIFQASFTLLSFTFSTLHSPESSLVIVA